MEYIAKSRAKFRIIEDDSSPRLEPKWITARRGNLFLYKDSLKFGDMEILISSVTEAKLITFTNSPQSGYLLELTIDNGEKFQFGLEDDPIWENQTVLPVTIESKEIEYSTFSIVYRVILFGIVAWLFSRWLISVIPSILKAPIDNQLITTWVIAISLVLSFDAVWAMISTRKNIRNLYGIFGSVIIYILSGYLAVAVTGSPEPISTAGLTGIVVALTDSTIGSLIASKIEGKKDVPRLQSIVLAIGTIMFQLFVGYGFAVFGGGLAN